MTVKRLRNLAISKALSTMNSKNRPLEVGASLSKKNCFICFNENPLKMMANAFHLILKALFCYQDIGIDVDIDKDVEKTAWLTF